MTIATAAPQPQNQMRLCVILTCFNRRAKTLACLKALAMNHLAENMALSAVLVDDGSTDGTEDALAVEFPWVQVVRTSGNLFWTRGMHQGMKVAMQSDDDFYLWLNDDTLLYADAISRLLATEATLLQQHGKPIIVVGSTVDEHTGILTYGGQIRDSSLRKMRFVPIQPNDKAQPCESMNGNIVLLSRQAIRTVGNLDPAFAHAMGDTDYALRANQQGVGVWVAPGFYGTCSGNAITGTYLDASLSMSCRWKLIMSRKGLPWRSWLLLTRRHAGPAWPLYFAWPYMRLVAGSLSTIAAGASIVKTVP